MVSIQASTTGSQAAAAMIMVKTTLTTMKPLKAKARPANRLAARPRRRARPKRYMAQPASASCSQVKTP